VQFRKYHGLGNDYVVLDPGDTPVLPPEQVQRICDRHFGIGGDGVLWGPFPPIPPGVPLPAPGPEPTVRIFNPDGSEAEKSGNGLRIFARYLVDTGRVPEEADFTLVTLGGLVTCRVFAGGREAAVEMGRASFRSADIPMTGPPREAVDEQIEVEGVRYRFCGVSVGNPHCVIPVEHASAEAARRYGPAIERDARFPHRVNVQFMEVVDRRRLRIEIWERGAGYTLASGSSACACAAAAHRLGLCDAEVEVSMPGGVLRVKVGPDYELFLRGGVTAVAAGVLSPEIFTR